MHSTHTIMKFKESQVIVTEWDGVPLQLEIINLANVVT